MGALYISEEDLEAMRLADEELEAEDFIESEEEMSFSRQLDHVAKRESGKLKARHEYQPKEETPEEREQRLAYFRKYNPQYYQTNKAKISAYKKDWWLRNKERIMAKRRAMREEKKKAHE